MSTNKQKKTESLIAYLCREHLSGSVTSIMKLCYLVDLTSKKKNGEQITNFTYKRYNYGPFDSQIYLNIENLVDDGVLKPNTNYTSDGREFVTYTLSEDSEEYVNILTDTEKGLADEVLESAKGYGAKMLTKVAYKTAPMKKLDATIGGEEGLNEELDLEAETE